MACSLVTVNILSWNRKSDLRITLQELKKTTYPNIEIIVVDNASTDGSPEMVESEFQYVELIRMPKNIGIAGWNIGFENAKGKYIVVLDDDSHPAPKAIEKMIEEFEKPENKSVGVIAFQIKAGSEQVNITFNWPKEKITFWGCGAGIRSSVLKKVGYYDEHFFIYANEIDLGIRVINAGYKIYYIPDCIAYHRTSPTNRGNWRNNYFGTRNSIWRIWKYYPISAIPLHTLITVYSRVRKAFRDREIYSFIKGCLAAFWGIHTIKDKRIVISQNTYDYIKKLVISEPNLNKDGMLKYLIKKLVLFFP